MGFCAVIICVASYLIRSLVGTAWLCWPGVARRLLTFFASPKKVSKERRPLLSATLRFASGTLRYSLQAGSAQTRLRLKQRAALIRLQLRSSARTEGRGYEHQQPFGPLLRSAWLPAPCSGEARSAQAVGSDHAGAQRNACSDPNAGITSVTTGRYPPSAQGACRFKPPRAYPLPT